MKKIISLMLMTTALTGCDFALPFAMPMQAAPPAFKEEAAGSWKEGEAAAHAPRGEWWMIFGDAKLDELETEAAAGNLDIQAMAARVEQARQTAKVAGAGFWPDIDGRASFTRQKPTAAARGMAPGTELAIENNYNLGLGIAYEIDLFGRVKNTVSAADEAALSAEAQLQSMMLALQADVANLYFSIIALDAERNLIEETLRLRKDSLRILNKRLEIGTITELDTAQATVDLETTRAELHKVTQQREELEHALALLLGKAPAEFTLEPAPLTASVPVIPAGLPSALLERRPDIAAAEHDLKSANSRLGVARAAFFPSISLTGTGGFESPTLGDVFQWSSRSWSIGPLISIPVFSGGAAAANSRRAKAAYEETVANYRKRVLVAFKDVEDSLSRLKSLRDQSTAQKVAEDAAVRSSRLADLRYDNGDVGYLEAITARRSALDLQRYGIQIQGARLAETIGLIRALGGGWDAVELQPAEPQMEIKPEVKTEPPVPAADSVPAPIVETPADPVKIEPKAGDEEVKVRKPVSVIISDKVKDKKELPKDALKNE